MQRRGLTLYERFEQIIAHILSIVISMGVFASLWQLVMTLLIAMEVKHSILRVMLRRDHIVQGKTAILVAMLAIARKFILLDAATAPAHIAALSAALVCAWQRLLVDAAA